MELTLVKTLEKEKTATPFTKASDLKVSNRGGGPGGPTAWFWCPGDGGHGPSTERSGILSTP